MHLYLMMSLELSTSAPAHVFLLGTGLLFKVRINYNLVLCWYLLALILFVVPVETLNVLYAFWDYQHCSRLSLILEGIASGVTKNGEL